MSKKAANLPNDLVLASMFPMEELSSKALGYLLFQARAADRYRKKRLREVKKAGSGHNKFEVQKTYLGSQQVRFSALLRAALLLEAKDRLKISEYQKLAATMKLHEPIPEKVEFFLKEKSIKNGILEYRCICNFGVQHRAAQAIVKDIVSAQFKPEKFQFGTPGRKITTAVKLVRKNYAAGKIHVERLDIKSYYDSFSHSALMGSGLMEPSFIENIAIGRYYNELYAVKLHDGTSLPHETALEYSTVTRTKGIPQGSSCSPIIGSFYVSKLKFKLPTGTSVLNYVDDFILMSKSAEKLSKGKNALYAAVKAISVGQFELLSKDGSSSPPDFEFLGHLFRIDQDGKLHVSITGPNLLNFLHREIKKNDAIVSIYEKGKKHKYEFPDWKQKILEHLESWAKFGLGWLSAFSEADDIEAHRLEFMESFENMCWFGGFDAAKLIKDTEPDLELIMPWTMS